MFKRKIEKVKPNEFCRTYYESRQGWVDTGREYFLEQMTRHLHSRCVALPVSLEEVRKKSVLR
jgi:hypothetical protein